MKSAAVITTGSELIKGKTADTNSVFLGRHLSFLGFEVKEHCTIPDRREEITAAVIRLLEENDVLIITGGLGPTSDDVTVEAIADSFGLQVVIDNKAKENIFQRFKLAGCEINDSDIKMASVPAGSLILENQKGLAPGFLLNIHDKILIALPGVPDEMKHCFSFSTLDHLKKLSKNSSEEYIFHFFGRKESELDDVLKALSCNMSFQWGITAEMGVITVTIFNCSHKHVIEINNFLKKEFDISMLLEENDTSAEELIKLLIKNRLSISTAESCTGGLISEYLTDIPGASAVFKGSVVAYSNDIKKNLLHLSDDIIHHFGAVSEETTYAMAENISSIMKSDIAVSTSGIAGPDGGTAKKPVGTVCFGFTLCGKTSSITKVFPGDRRSIRIRSALFALDYVRRYLRNL